MFFGGSFSLLLFVIWFMWNSIFSVSSSFVMISASIYDSRLLGAVLRAMCSAAVYGPNATIGPYHSDQRGSFVMVFLAVRT